MRLTDIGDPRKGEAAVELRADHDLSRVHPRSLFVFGVRRGDPSAARFASMVTRDLVARGMQVAGWVGPGATAAAQGLEEMGASIAIVSERSASGVDAFVAEQRRRLCGLDAAADVGVADLIECANCAVVAVGTVFPARASARASVALTAGLPRAGWSPAARAVAHRAHLQLAEARSGVAARWAQLLSGDR